MKELKNMSPDELCRLFPIILKKHNSDYKSWYAEEKENLLRLLHDFEVCRMNHIGSTSVAGMIAKPIIDILLELPGDYFMNRIAFLLQDSGWILMAKNDTKKTIDLNKGYTPNGFEEKVYHLHIKPIGDWNELYFRDYLKAHSDAAQEYETLKLNLLKQFEYNRDAYTNAKSEFILKYTKKAREEFNGRYLPLHQ